MAGFWYPYADFAEAQRRLTAFANATLGPHCGISFSNGISIGVVRQPAGTGSHWIWLNVLAQHIAAPPPPPPPAPSSAWGHFTGLCQHAFNDVVEADREYYKPEIQAAQRMGHAVEEHVWLPVHRFMLRHKTVADGVGVALDAVGVVAGVAFIIAAAPEVVGVAAVAGIVTATAATVASVVLLVVDGTVFATEVSGNKARAEQIENNHVVQWVRIGATVALLPDLAVGGVRALGDIGKLGTEAREATAASAKAGASEDAARARVGKIANPARHPGPVARRMRRVAAFERARVAQAKRAEDAQREIRITKFKDLGIVPGATLGGTGLLVGAPPDVALSREQREQDEKYRRNLAPAGGMPKDVKLEMRVSSHQRVPSE